jgi:NAD(P)-dependent dehydrogenase (short-subunit alcohol dehydrogenase family)
MNICVMHFGHYLLTKLLTPLLKNPNREKEHGSGRVVNHASAAAFGRPPLHPSVYIGDGEGSLRGERPEANGCAHSVADVIESRGQTLCPFLGGYSYAKMWQVGITPMMQEDFDSLPGRKIVTSSMHPGCVYSKILSHIYEDFFDPGDWMMSVVLRPTEWGSNVLIFSLLDDTYTPGAFIDDHYGAHDMTKNPHEAHPHSFSLIAKMYRKKFQQADPTEGFKRMREISERIVAPYAEEL